jgi:hypothetical protein
MVKRKRTNNDMHNITQKNKDRATQTTFERFTVAIMTFVVITIRYWPHSWRLIYQRVQWRIWQGATAMDPSGAHEFTPGFSWGLCCSIFILLCNVMHIVVCPFSFDRCSLSYPSLYSLINKSSWMRSISDCDYDKRHDGDSKTFELMFST